MAAGRTPGSSPVAAVAAESTVADRAVAEVDVLDEAEPLERLEVAVDRG